MELSEIVALLVTHTKDGKIDWKISDPKAGWIARGPLYKLQILPSLTLSIMVQEVKLMRGAVGDVPFDRTFDSPNPLRKATIPAAQEIVPLVNLLLDTVLPKRIYTIPSVLKPAVLDQEMQEVLELLSRELRP